MLERQRIMHLSQWENCRGFDLVRVGLHSNHVRGGVNVGASAGRLMQPDTREEERFSRAAPAGSGGGELKSKQREVERQQEVKEWKYLPVEVRKVWIP